MKRYSTVYVVALLLLAPTACGGTGGDGGNNGSGPAAGENLVESPDAEGSEPLADWQDTGCLNATDYGTGDGPDAMSEGPSERGGAYFSARDAVCNDTVAAVQWIEDVSDLREQKVLGDIPYDYEISGYLGGWADDPDHASFSAYFLNDDDRLLQAATIGPVTREDRDGESKLLERSVSDSVPDATERIMLLLEFRRIGQGQHKGVADNLSFSLKEDDG